MPYAHAAPRRRHASPRVPGAAPPPHVTLRRVRARAARAHVARRGRRLCAARACAGVGLARRDRARLRHDPLPQLPDARGARGVPVQLRRRRPIGRDCLRGLARRCSSTCGACRRRSCSRRSRGTREPISSLAFGSDVKGNAFLASGSWDKTVRVWDFLSSKSSIDVLKHNTDVTALAFSPDGGTLACTTLDGQVSLWDAKEAEQIGAIDGRADVTGGRSAISKARSATGTACFSRSPSPPTAARCSRAAALSSRTSTTCPSATCCASTR